MTLPRETRKEIRRWTRRGLVVVALLWLLALGGVHPAINLALGLLVIASAGVGLRMGEPMPLREIARNPVVILILLALGATGLQLLPMPASWVALGSGDYHASLLAASQRSWLTQSLDPVETCHELLKLVVYLAAAVAAITLFPSARKRRLLLIAAALGGTTLLLLGGLHVLLGWNTTYNGFGPSRSVLVSSLVNSNHLGTFLGFAALASAALARLQRRFRWLFAINAVACGMGLFFTLSRGAIVVFVAVVLLVGVAQLLSRKEQDSRQMREAWPVIAVLCAALGAVALLYRRLVYEYLPSTTGPSTNPKIDLWKSATDIAFDFPLFGVGRGALSTVSYRYHPWAADVTVTHIESEWLQVIVDWGLLFGVPILALAIYAGVRAAQRVSPRHYLELAAVGMVALHNLFEFSAFLPALAVPALMILSSILHDRSLTRKDKAQPAEQPRSSFKAVLIAGGAATALLAITGAMSIAYNIRRDTQRVRAAVEACTVDWEERLDGAIARHPADYFLPLYGATGSMCTRDFQRALQWANRSLQLRNDFYATHRLIAHVLWKLGAAPQAILELRLSCEASPKRCPSLLEDFQRLNPSPHVLAEAGHSENKDVRYAVAAHLMRNRRQKAALYAIGAAAQEHPEFLPLQLRAYRELGLLNEAAAAAQEYVEHFPRSGHIYRQWADIVLAKKQPGRALEIMKLGLENAPHNAELLNVRARLLLHQGALDEALQAAEEILSNSIDPNPRSAAFALIGDIHRRQGTYARALWAYRKARDLRPDVASLRVTLAELQQHMGDHMGARLELRKALEELGESAEIRAALAELQGN